MRKGSKQPQETKDKIRNSLLGRHHTEESKQKMRGLKRSKESCQKMSLSRLGKPLTDEHKKARFQKFKYLDSNQNPNKL